MIKKLILLSCLLGALLNNTLMSQSKGEIKNMFYDAESWILFEDYKEALPLYLQLAKIYPKNYNYKYRIGQCYINIPGEKDKAISYLEDAIKHVNPKYREGKFREMCAPYDVLYYLANAYRINNQLDKALESYRLFSKNLNPKVYDTAIVNLQIQSCLNAKELIAKPQYVRERNLGSLINKNNSESNPVISDDENMLVFTRSEAFYDAILYSTRNNGQWSSPINMNELLKNNVLRADNYFYPTSLSKDGKDLYLYCSVGYDGTIYSTRFENGTWSPLVKLNENINTKYWESHATVSHDNNKLFFTSNRKGTYGGLDIYISVKDSTGNWGPAKNIGPVINTPYNEETPFLSEDDKTLFFSSRGHFNIGGYDIFYSSLLENGEWSVPLNVGYPLNTTDDDVFFCPIQDGNLGYMAKYSPDGYGKQDIYKIEVFSEEHPRKFLLIGIVKVADLVSNFEDSVKVSTMSIKNPNKTIVVYSNPKTGEFEVQIPQGNYEVIYEANGSETMKRIIDIPLSFPSDSFVLPGTVLPKSDFVADLFVKSNKNISVTKGDTLLLPLNVEPRSVLNVERWLSDSLISSEEFYIRDTVFNYKMVPLPGKNKVTFKLTDRFNNSTSTDVFITMKKEVVTKPLVRPEYGRVIVNRQITALIEMLKRRADGKLRKVITESPIAGQEFGKADDLITNIRAEAAKNNIGPEEVDKLALKVAVMDNVLTQASVDLMAKYSEDDLKKILENLDIYQTDLKTWTDLQEYISNKTAGKVTPEELRKIAEYILSEADPSIAVIREKIIVFSNNSSSGYLIKQSVMISDKKGIKKAGQWLKSIYYELLKQGFTNTEVSGLFAAISSFPSDRVEEYIQDYTKFSQEPLLSWLKSLDLKKEKIRTPEGLIQFILENRKNNIFPEDLFFNGMSELIVSKEIPSESIQSWMKGGKNKLWVLLIVLGTILIFLIMAYLKRKKKRIE
jgi:hypothetical protein